MSNKYTAKIEVGNQSNIFVFESGDWINTGLGFMIPSESMELYLITRFHGLFSSSLKMGWFNEEFSIDLKRIKNAWANPSMIKNKKIPNG